MSQGGQDQPRRPQSETEPVPIKYGDVFDVHGKLADEPVAPGDAATVQEAENIVVGKVQEGGPGSVMQSAADINERRGVVRHDQATSFVTDVGVTISEAEIDGRRIITEAVGGEVVGQYTLPKEGDVKGTRTVPDLPVDPTAVTIGEALEAAGLSAGDKVLDQGDAAAIHVAEMRATGLDTVMPGGIAAEAQSAAAHNAGRTTRDDDKITLGAVLEDATSKLVDDKPVTREDAEGVVAAETRNRPDLATFPGGVAASVTAAAKSMMSQGGQPETESIKSGEVLAVSASQLDEKPASPPADAAAGLEADGTVIGLIQIQECSSQAEIMFQATVEGEKSRGQIITQLAVDEEDVVGQCSVSKKEDLVIITRTSSVPDSPVDPTAVTVEQALEAAGLSAGEDDQGASFIVEMRESGFERLMPGGLAAEIQSVAARKVRRITRDDDKIVLKAAADKLMDEEYAEGFIAEILKNTPSLAS
ncbi:OLC1v1007272C1 [Oldenlandia corymbosa var. corymbosa]|uniref:OLC1v1007272C1 n=1 Tax=Oldenlandia corymbosa var. corymbosa TaxID=529605 RepID=A0AAV1DL92_OLDCO|nr:OLC1v1007272C1 [Oldenlandia corymbosa var. corymbosa]